MTAAQFLRNLVRRGVHLTAAGDAVEIDAPWGVLSEDDRIGLIAHKAALLALLRSEGQPVIPTPTGVASLDRLEPYRTTYAAITAGYGTPEDLQACTWLDTGTDRDVVREIAVLERRCDALSAAGAPESAYREAVEALVAFFDEARRLYGATHRRAEDG